MSRTLDCLSCRKPFESDDPTLPDRCPACSGRWDKAAFLALVAEWSQAWDAAFDRGEPDFGTESTLEDWLGSIEAYASLAPLKEGATHEHPPTP